MKSFRLPDLGEGLDEAELVSWHVNVGDRVVADQHLVSVETAKAVVEVPSPWSGRIARLIGKPHDRIKVGDVLVEFEDDEGPPKDAGTVVGSLESPASPSAPERAAARLPKAAPAVRALARERGVDLATLRGTGPDGAITRADVDAAREDVAPSDGFEPLRGVRRAMAENMARSALEVPGSTVTEEVIVDHWSKDEDITARLILAVVDACRVEPCLNAWYENTRKARKIHARVDLGMALNTADGLFVPVLRNADRLKAADLREAVNRLKRSVADRKVSPSDLANPTITLSNFGMMGGLYASLAIVPPQVAILGAGRIFDAVRAEGDGFKVRRMLPLSLTFDHRVVTGAEAVRFLNAIVHALSTASSQPETES